MGSGLRERRQSAVAAWRRYIDLGQADAARAPVAESWRRSANAVTPSIEAAPTEGADDAVAAWWASEVAQAVRTQLPTLVDIAESQGFVAAVTDAEGRIVWTHAGRRMARRAERVNFAVGGRWSEEAIGTNALGLALRGESAEVFAAEHYAEVVHDWACWSAPILAPDGRVLGVVDLSSAWSGANPLALSVVRAVAAGVTGSLASARPAPPAVEALELRTLGSPRARFRGAEMPLSLRQFELLVVLAHHPDGIGLDTLHALVHGDAPVRPETVKAEVSRLRRALGGCVAGRPYRLTTPVVADHLMVLDRLGAGDLDGALDWYRGELLSRSESPFVAELRYLLRAELTDAVARSGSAAHRIALLRIHPEDRDAFA